MVLSANESLNERAWSVSALKSMGTCGFQWANKYDEETRIDSTAQQTVPLAWGSFQHKVIERFHKEELFSPRQWQSAFYEEWAKATKNVDWTGYNKKTFENLAFRMISSYIDDEIDQHPDREGDILHIEYVFPQDDAVFRIGGFKIKGVIDQIRRQPNGQLWVIDMKTSKNLPDPFVLRGDPQFTFYAHVVHDMYGEWPRLSWLHLRTGELVDTERGPADVEMVAEMIAQADQKVKQRMFARNIGYNCGMCEFKVSCLGKIGK